MANSNKKALREIIKNASIVYYYGSCPHIWTTTS